MPSRVAVVVPEHRLMRALAPIIAAARARGVQVLWPGSTYDDVHQHAVLVGLDGFVPHVRRRRVLVDNFFDCFRRRPDPTATMCYMSPFHRDMHARLWHERPAGEVVGCLWARPLPSGPRTRAVFFTPKVRGVDPERRRLWFQHVYLRALLLARRAAAYHGLTFVVKTRAKHGDPWWLRLVARPVADAGDSLDLLAGAQWCVHFGSAAALEAVYAGAFAFWTHAPEHHITDSPGWDHRPRWMAWPGLARLGLPRRQRWSDFLALDAREEYLATFLGECDGKAAERVLDLAESLT